MTMLRSSLIAALFHQMLSLPVEGVSESAAMALMGSEAEAFAEYFHTTITDTWADILQLALAIYLIARMTLTGAIVVAPVIVAICTSSTCKLHCCLLATLTLSSFYLAIISCWGQNRWKAKKLAPAYPETSAVHHTDRGSVTGRQNAWSG